MNTSAPVSVLVLYYSKHGATKAMASAIAEGVVVAGGQTMLRTVPEVGVDFGQPIEQKPDHLFCTLDELAKADALVVGSATRFGNMAAPLKYFWDQTTPLWLNGALQGKPASVFTSSASMHGGQESTLLTMMMPLLHHGMVLVGLPYAHPELSDTKTGGTPYGASHVSGTRHQNPLSSEELRLCRAQGERMVDIAIRLRKSP